MNDDVARTYIQPVLVRISYVGVRTYTTTARTHNIDDHECSAGTYTYTP
jgi:hypothetical protein